MEKREEDAKKQSNEDNPNRREDIHSNKGMRGNTIKQQLLTRRNKYKRRKYGHIVGKVKEEKRTNRMEVSNIILKH